MEVDSTSISYFITLLIVGVVYSFLCFGLYALIQVKIRRLEDDQVEGAAGIGNALTLYFQRDLYISGIHAALFILSVFTGGILYILWKGGEISSPLEWVILLFIAFVDIVLVQLMKGVGLTYPEGALRYAGLPLMVLVTPFIWLIKPFHLVSRFFLTKFELKAEIGEEEAASAEEISDIVERSGEAGTIEEDEREMIEGVLEMNDTPVREVMTPRVDIISVVRGAEIEDAVGKFVEEGLSRLLVIGDELDQVEGLLVAKDLIPLIGKGDSESSIDIYIRPIHSVPQSMKTDDVLKDLQMRASHMAVVLDDHGGVAGIVTVEDLLEEIVGEIFDEHDIPEDEVEVTEMPSGDLVVDGSTTVDELNSSYDFSIPEGEYDTIAGFVVSELGRVPEPGEMIVSEDQIIKVEEVEQNRITQIRIIISSEDKE